MFLMMPFAHVFDAAIAYVFDTAVCATLSTFICSYVAKTTNFEITMVRFVIPEIIGIAVYLEKNVTGIFLYSRDDEFFVLYDERLEHALTRARLVNI